MAIYGPFNCEGGTPGSTFSGTSLLVEPALVFNAAHPAHGSMGCAFLNPGTTTATARKALTSETKVEIVAYVYLTALPSGSGNDLDLLRGSYTGDISGGLFRINNAGFARLITAGAVVQWTDATGTFPTGQQVRIGLYLEAGTSTTTGKAHAAYFLGDSTTPVAESGLISGINTAAATAAFVNARFGKLSSGSFTGDGHLDDITIRTGTDATGTFAPYVNTPPTVNAGTDQTVAAAATVNLTATANDPDGSIASHAWTYDFPASGGPSLTGGSTATPSLTAGSAPNLYLLRDTVTDNLGGTASDVVEVRVPTAGTFTPLPATATKTGTVTRTGGTTDGGVLADSDDATFMELEPGASLVIRVWPILNRTGYIVTFRLGAAPGTTGSAVVSLLQGGTQIQASSTISLTSTIVDHPLTVTNPALITDPGNLYVRVVAS